MKLSFGSYLIAFFIIAVSTFSSCYNDNELDLYGSTSCDTTNVSYSLNIVPILSANCYLCHKSGVALGGIVLDTYTTASDLALSGSFLGALKHQAPYSPMPKGGNQLIQCDIDKLERWVLNGVPEN